MAEDKVYRLSVLLDAYRKQNLETELQYSTELEIVASMRVEDMIDYNYHAHFGPEPNYQSVYSVIQAQGLRCSAAGENIGWITTNDDGEAVDLIFQGFIDSPTHRANILSNTFTHWGGGFGYNNGRELTCVMVFARFVKE